MLEAGDKLPEFLLPDQTGANRSLDDLAGREGLILYAYPKDNTPGCTTEALEFSEQLAAFKRKGYNVVGISKDSVKAHGGFVAKHDLKVTLVSDGEAGLLQAIGAWGDKKMRGKTYQGIIRSTFVVQRDGTVKKVYPTVKAKGHAAQVLADL